MTRITEHEIVEASYNGVELAAQKQIAACKDLEARDRKIVRGWLALAAKARKGGRVADHADYTMRAVCAAGMLNGVNRMCGKHVCPRS